MVKIDSDSYIEKCCAPEYSRLNPNLEEVYFDAEKKRVVASNGHIVAIVPAECTDDEKSRYMTVDEIAARRKPSKMEGEVKFPLPAFDVLLAKPMEIAVGIDLKLLTTLVSAMGLKQHIVLRLSRSGIENADKGCTSYLEAIRVEADKIERKEVVGFIMPRRV